MEAAKAFEHNARAAIDVPASARWAGLLTPLGVAMTSILGLAFIGLFFRWFMLQAKLSWDQLEDWGHAFFVPFFSFYLIWLQREQLARIVPKTYWPGVVPLVVGIISYFYFVAGFTNHMAQGVCMLMALFGILLLTVGLQAMRVLFLPLLFLVFMIEVSKMIMILITGPLRSIAAQGGYVALSLISWMFGYTVDLTGNVLKIQPQNGAVIDLDIAEACSGMRMVVAFVALAAATALYACKPWWQRAAVLLLAVPVAVFINVLRVTILGLLSLIDRDLASGEAHTLIGTILLAPGLGMFLAIVWALKRIVIEPEVKKTATPIAVKTMAPAVEAARIDWSRLRQPGFMTCVAILLLSGVAMGSAIRLYKLNLEKLPVYPETGHEVRGIPSKTDHWERLGADMVFPIEISQELGTDNYVSRYYKANEPREGNVAYDTLDLHLAYYTGLLDAVPHVPERCFTGGGLSLSGGPWTVDVPLKSADWMIDSATDPSALPIYTTRVPNNEQSRRPGQRVALPRGLSPDHPLQLRVSRYTDHQGRNLWAGYFFIANGGWVSTAEGVRSLAFKLSDDYAYFLKVQFGSQSVNSPEELAMLAGSLMDDLLAEIMLCVPDWRRVERGEWPPDNPRKPALSPRSP